MKNKEIVKLREVHFSTVPIGMAFVEGETPFLITSRKGSTTGYRYYSVILKKYVDCGVDSNANWLFRVCSPADFVTMNDRLKSR